MRNANMHNFIFANLADTGPSQAMYQYCLVLVVVSMACRALAEADPQPPVWPSQFHAVLFQNRTGNKLAILDLWYDWPGGRNFNIIRTQLGTTIYDLELNSGEQYMWFDDREDCKTIHQPVGILTPDWLSNATYLGVDRRDSFDVDVWTKTPWPTKDRMFVHYYADRTTGQPVFWQFFDQAQFHVLKFEVNKTLPDSDWQEPGRCHDSSTAHSLLHTTPEEWLHPMTGASQQMLASSQS